MPTVITKIIKDFHTYNGSYVQTILNQRKYRKQRVMDTTLQDTAH